MWKRIRKIFFRYFKFYRILEVRDAPYSEANKLIRESVGKPESEKWDIYPPYEDNNHSLWFVWICRKQRITE